MKTLRSFTATFVAMTVLMGCNNSSVIDQALQAGPDPVLPEPQDFFIPPMQVPTALPWKEGETPKVIDGLKIEKIADGLLHPRQVYVLDNNDILVVESNGPGTEPKDMPKQLIMSVVKNASGKAGKGGNRITLLRNVNGTWQKHIFLENLFSPFGVQVVGETLYVANVDGIMKYHYQPGATKITDKGVFLADLPSGYNHHWTKALLASPDGSKLYAAVGSNSNVLENGVDAEYRRAAILEVDAKTGASRIFASGLRNPTGIQWEPVSGKLWAIVNERDEIGADLVPDYMTSVKEGEFYGWPYSYYGQHVDRRAMPPRPDLVAKAIKPDYALSTHVAPLGIVFYTGNSLPTEYHGGAFISEHGSWDRSPLNGYQIVFVPFKNGMPYGKPKTVVSGFVTEDEKHVRGLPTGIAMDKQGALVFADDAANIIWRVTAAR